MRKFSIIIILICLILSGCSSEDTTISSSESITNNEYSKEVEERNGYEIPPEQTENEETEIASEDSIKAIPFEVLIDKTSLQIGKVEQTTVLIVTELEDWSYSVEADYGKISNIGSNSFDYTRPKNKDQKEDNISIQLVDSENGIQHTYDISLIFTGDAEIDNVIFKE